MPGIVSLLTNYWLDEFVVVLVAGAILLVIELWLESRRGTRIEINPYPKDERLGFRIWPRGGDLHSPQVIFNAQPFRQEWRADSFPLDLFDKDGNPYKKDFVLADESFCVFPFVASHEFREVRDGYHELVVHVSHVFGHYAPHMLAFGIVDGDKGSSIMRPNKDVEVMPMGATLRIYAKGWRRAKVYHYLVNISPIVFPHKEDYVPIGKGPSADPEDWRVFYNLTLKKGREWH